MWVPGSHQGVFEDPGLKLTENDLLGSGYFRGGSGVPREARGSRGPGSSWAGGSGRSRTHGGDQRAGEEQSRGEVPGGVRGVGRPGGIGERGAPQPSGHQHPLHESVQGRAATHGLRRGSCCRSIWHARLGRRVSCGPSSRATSSAPSTRYAMYAARAPRQGAPRRIAQPAGPAEPPAAPLTWPPPPDRPAPGFSSGSARRAATSDPKRKKKKGEGRRWA